MNATKLLVCSKCNIRFFLKDGNYYNKEPVCEECYDQIPSALKKDLVCAVPHCKNRRNQCGILCDFHCQDQLLELLTLVEDINKNESFK